MGRVKLKIKKLDSINARQATYCKRKNGIMKKAKELSILCDIDVVLLMFSPAGKPSLCCGKHSIGEVIAKFAQLAPQERAKRKLDNLEALKKTFMKLDHDVNISEFLERSKPTIEVLSEQVRFLQTHLSEIHTRLSYWTEVEKVDSIDDLQQLENSVRQSLYQIRVHKENMLHHQQQQQQLMSNECKNELQSDIDLDFGIDIEQQLENFSWVRTDENMNAPIKEEDPNLQFYHTYKDLTCSASSSLESYSGLFGKSSDFKTPKVETGGNPGPLVDPNLQYSNLSFLNDPKLQQLAEWNLLGSPADYYVSQILEASYRPQFGGNWPSSETLNYPFTVFDDPLLSRCSSQTYK
ncbi:agamous-like MADS-box protein AGL30 [Raphanus sativus]|uniref:Agamous-like MADS-box protein AGL30 n=1 Tax=Raphanus sativus TaxID=3726 RepID=A0A6J0L6N6_RAPSA|nr:agamous-like MADS-box protein AGL30 [Raphanus sativus]XP_056855793.1 agamous-like MADS-box protein AGL30 [Raphanus sativus]